MGAQERVFNVLTIIVLILTLITILCYLAIFINPYLPINPFPPKAIIQVATRTPTATPGRVAPPTWTPTTTPTITPTPPATFTPTPTLTPTRLPTLTPTRTLTPTPAPTLRMTRAPYPFTYEITYETPYYGCQWMGVAGNIQDIDGNPLSGYPVHIWGGGIDVVVTSGSKQMYGDAGWEQFFSNQPMEANGVFRVQLHSRDDPNHPPISQEIVLNFAGYCSQSMAQIIFTKNH